MAQHVRGSELASVRGRRATLYDFQLSGEAPLFADSNDYADMTPLEIEVHAGAEAGIVLSGSEEHHLDDHVFRAEAGDVWLTSTWEPHGWRVASRDTEDVVLIFLPEFLGEEQLGNLSWLNLFVVPPRQRPRVRTAEARQRVLALGHDLRREIQQRRPAWQTAVRLGLLNLMLTLSRDWRPPNRPSVQPRVRTTNMARIMPALSLVHADPLRRVSVQKAAAACALGRAQFCAIFQETMGVSFGRFCQRSRLGHAAELLLSTDCPTDTIAKRTGFTDGSHLHKAFLKRYGCTPGQYRSEHRPH
ncbi:MAG: helix-turn-helix domain-containing protein [Armatimonadota bacterium]